MKTDKHTDFLDTFCRAYLLEVVEETSYSNYEGLVRFIVHEATYEQVVLAVFDQRKFLREQDEVDNDIERSRRIQGIEQAVKPVLGISVAFLASTDKIEGPIKQAVENLLKGKKGRIARFLKKRKAGDTAGGLVGQIAIGILTYLVGKVIFVTWEKSKSVCRNKCKEKIPAEENHRRLRIKVCESQCKVAGYKKMIAKLRSEISRCKSMQNPEKCQTTLVKHVGKYNDMFEKEEARLRRLTAQLNSKAAVAKRKDTTAARPPEIR